MGMIFAHVRQRALKRAMGPLAGMVEYRLPHVACTSGSHGLRLFSAAVNPLDTTAAFYKDFVQKSVTEFAGNQKTVSDDLDKELAANKWVVFMEGSPDAPKSELGLNVVKMLTQAQIVPFLAIDVLQHPALLGYAVSKTDRERVPHVYCDGSFFADHDGLLDKHKSGELQAVGTATSKSTGVFAGELPIASY